LDEAKTASALITWQVKVLKEDAVVEFFYRRQGDRQFSSLVAEKMTGASFQVEFSLSVP